MTPRHRRAHKPPPEPTPVSTDRPTGLVPAPDASPGLSERAVIDGAMTVMGKRTQVVRRHVHPGRGVGQHPVPQPHQTLVGAK